MKTNLVLVLLVSSFTVFAQTTIVLQPGPDDGKDARIFNLDGGTNFGEDPDFIAPTWLYGKEPGTMRSLIQFDLSAIPNGAGIVDARLSLYYNDVSTTPGQAPPNASYLRRIREDWDENTVRWVDFPSYTTENEVLLQESSTSDQDYTNINVAALIRDMLQDPGHSYGFMFMGANETPSGAMKFWSSDAPDPAVRPKLEITYILEEVDCFTAQPGNGGGKDAKVYSLDPESNYANDPDFIAAAWTFGETNGLLRSYMEFDLNAIPANADILNAYLSLFYNPNSSSHGQEGDNAALLQRITEPWSETTLSWGDQPATTSENQVALPASMISNQSYENINVTQLIRDMLNNPSSGYGIMMRLATEENFRAIKFATSDHPDATKWPRLEICYTLGVGNKEIHYQTLELFPNPFDQSVTISGLNGTYIFSLTDFQGMEKARFVVDDVQSQITIDLPDQLGPGMYMLRASGPDGNFLNKIMKAE